ncbi:MAG: 16S rRNA (cytosine(1402)-N(4))-methyltransferase RsmH [Thermoguttaceae bacterium]|nr:16S rRNA (cytosine(1402)-N(4))-methyltransferase RsmH [Thermoguttaceae bacterium]
MSDQKSVQETDLTPNRTVHRPVLFQEVLDMLAPEAGGVYVDGTLGGGGHSLAIADRIGPAGLVISIDRDAAALDRVEARLAREPAANRGTVRMAQTNYADFPAVLEMLGIEKVNGFLLDLGLSSDQLADRTRGFSFNADGDLDLRFDVTEGEPAWQLLARRSAEEIAEIIFRYGEERFSRRIAREIVRRRETEPIRKASQLAEICRRVIPAPPGRDRQRIDPATRTFQALRIAVNDELGSLERFLRRAPDRLLPGGKIAIISFHSLEDRIVKTAFRDTPGLEVLTRKPIEAGQTEQQENPRARSAKLRVARRVL